MKTILKKLTTSIGLIALLALTAQTSFAQQTMKEKHDSTKVEAKRKHLGENRREVLKDVANGDGKEASADYKKLRRNEKMTKAQKKEWKAERKKRKAAEIK